MCLCFIYVCVKIPIHSIRLQLTGEIDFLWRIPLRNVVSEIVTELEHNFPPSLVETRVKKQLAVTVLH